MCTFYCDCHTVTNDFFQCFGMFDLSTVTFSTLFAQINVKYLHKLNNMNINGGVYLNINDGVN